MYGEITPERCYNFGYVSKPNEEKNPGGCFMRMRPYLFLSLIFWLVAAVASAQTQFGQEKDRISVVVEDMQGKRTDGYLQSYPREFTVTTKDNRAKSVLLKMIESIKVEKVKSGLPGPEEMKGEGRYSVRLQNSQEILTLNKKYTLNFVTSVGVETRTIDPDAVQGPLNGKPQAGPLLRDKSVIFSLEFKF